MAKATESEPHHHQPDLAHFRMQPHRTQTFKLSPNPFLIDKARD